MDVRNCPRCGRIFRPTTHAAVCPACQKVEAEEFETVRTYLRENPHAAVMQVSQETGVSPKRIYAFVREGRLRAASAESDLNVACDICGTKIPTGKLCEKCQEAMANKTNPQRRITRQGMRTPTLDRFRRR